MIGFDFLIGALVGTHHQEDHGGKDESGDHNANGVSVSDKDIAKLINHKGNGVSKSTLVYNGKWHP